MYICTCVVCTMSFLDSQFPSHLFCTAQHFTAGLSWKCYHWIMTSAEKAMPQRTAWQPPPHSLPWISFPSLWCSVSRARLENVMLTMERNRAGLFPWLLPQLQDGSLGNPTAPPKALCFPYCFLGTVSLNQLLLSLGRRKVSSFLALSVTRKGHLGDSHSWKDGNGNVLQALNQQFSDMKKFQNAYQLCLLCS